jgi:hypothetical protein
MYKIYLISSHHKDEIYYKIGWTKRDPIKRLKELKTGNSQELELLQVFESKWGPKIESSLHRNFKHVRCEGEWFKLSLEDANNFQSLCKMNHDSFEILAESNSWFQESKQFRKYFSN